MIPAVDDAARALRSGALVVIPTDTVYGIAALPDDPTATARLFEAKHRPPDLELPVLVADLTAAEAIAVLDDRARVLAARFWPGALTLVVPRSTASAAWSLGGDAATVGVRVPDDPLARALLSATGPLAVSSANRSGEPTPATCDGVAAVFGDLVDVYLCAEGPLGGRASTVVDLAHGEPRILREGAIPADDVTRTLDASGEPHAHGGSDAPGRT